MSGDERIERARQLYERAVFGGDAGVLAEAERELDRVEADLAVARGRIAHARFLAEQAEDPSERALFDRALGLYQALGDPRGEADALFWIGVYHQVVRHDDEAAVPVLRQSADLARRTGDPLTLSYALRHLGTAEHRAGRLAAARRWLEESVRLRREIGFRPGVAANLVGLAYIAVGEGRQADARALLDEADAIAEETGAHAIARQVAEARHQL
jgi:tetratricopeptide (TPR) repeat protein